MFEELWKFIQAHYKAKRYHLVLGNIQLLIPLFNEPVCSNRPYLKNVLKELQGIFIHLDTLAHEFRFRDYLHRCFITPIYQQINQVDTQLAKSFLQHLMLHMPRNDRGRVPYIKYEHTFQIFYNLVDQDPDKQLRLARGQRVNRLLKAWFLSRFLI